MTTALDSSLADFRPRWSLGTALAYGGALIVLVADNWALYWFGHDHKVGGAFLALGFFVAFTAIAAAFKRRGDALTAGLAALLAVEALPWVIAALAQVSQDAHGFISFSPDVVLLHQPHGTAGSWAGVDATAIVVALLYLARYRLPLLMAPVVFGVWFIGQEIAASTTPRVSGAFLASHAPGKSAAAAFVVAALLLGFGLWLDSKGWRREALWPHIGAALSVVFGLLMLASRYDHDAVASAGLGLAVIFLLLAIGFRRSVYGVVGGLGIVLTGTYLLDRALTPGTTGVAFLVAAVALVVAVIGLRLTRDEAAT